MSVSQHIVKTTVQPSPHLFSKHPSRLTFNWIRIDCKISNSPLIAFITISLGLVPAFHIQWA